MAIVELRLIGTTDLHAHVAPHDYYRDGPDPARGLAKAATLIAQARAEAANALVFDNGDLIQGSPLGDWAAQALGARRIDRHPMIEAMNAVGYDAATVGNHEFNYGLDLLDAALTGATFPFLCANVFRADGSSYFPPWTLLRQRVADRDGGRRDLVIGVIGFVTPQIVRWDMSHLKGRASALGIVESARRHIPACRAAGADVIVALCHAGVAQPGAAGADENAALALAQLGGVDAIFVGHQHLLLPGDDFAGLGQVDAAGGALAGTPAVMAGFWGGHIGVIDLTLETSTSGWRVAGAAAALRKVEAATPADAAVLAATQSAHAATLAYVRLPVGEIDQALTSYFAMVGDDASVRIVHDAQLWYARQLPLPALPLLSASAPFKCGGRGGLANYTQTPGGSVALRHVADLYVFPNGLRVVRASGAQLREWLERAASVFRRLDPAVTEPQPLLAANFAAYDFDSIAGVSYRLDLTQPARYDDQGALIAPDAHRVVDLAFEGRPIDAAAAFLIVTNSYRAGGGGHFPGCDGSSILYEAPDSNFDALLQYVKSRPRVEVSPGGGWRLAPWPNSVTATLLAPPQAAAFAPPPEIAVAPIGPGPDGFMLFRVRPK
ncbi:MAG: bifunctional 2',3'-cyclic-nucleotide 2'-phosphodiesterase/3'-nucleotidase [Pseudomonadota bacterium]|nr:bifunctional 2',3'-cyclic-nucleotide 2'-phosphodiesterase/3'-nucleotidase [Pseudomonadota bacterium]